MDLTTVARVKILMAWPPEQASGDEVLAQLIAAVSAEVERALGRGVEIRERTQVFSPFDGQRLFLLDGYPNLTIASVKEDTTLRTFAEGAEELEVATDYSYDEESGFLYIDRWALTPGRRTLQVVSTGGMAASPDDLALAYPDLASAVDGEVVLLFRRRDSIGMTTASMGGVSKSFQVWKANEGPHEALQAAIERHRRIVV